jgi:hypothetical protein
MKQSNRYANYLGRKEAHEQSKSRDPKGRAKNIAGCSLHRIDKSKGYENNPNDLIRQLRWKHVIVNDGHQTEVIDISQDISVEVPPKSIYIGLAKDVGNRTKGKLDFMRSQGFSIFGMKGI